MITSILLNILAVVVSANAMAGMNSMPTPGVYLNSDGSPVLPMIRNARNFLDMEIYTMKSQTVRDEIRGALQRGVYVQIIMEPTPVGSKCKVFSNQTDSTDCSDLIQLMKEVRDSGGKFEPFNKENLCPNSGGHTGHGCYQHGKMVLADGVSLVSTGNFDSTNLCIDGSKTCDRDFTLVLSTSSIYHTLKNVFEADLKGDRYDLSSLIPNDLARVLTISPDSQSPLIEFIKSAHNSIDLEAQYLNDPAINSALVSKARSGVRVSVTVASPCAFGRPKASTKKEVETTYSNFDKSGISTQIFNSSNRINGKPGYMHAKVIVVDGTRAWLGSENGSNESLTQNREYGVIFNHYDWVEFLSNTITQDHNSPDSETWQDSLMCKKGVAQ